MTKFFKKQFGQNFLRNREFAKKLVEAANICKSDIVLEVGAGAGMVTQYLVPKAKEVIVYEIDSRFTKLLENRFLDDKNLRIVNDDILNIKVEKLDIAAQKYKVVGSLPYNISKKIIKKFLESEICPSSITVIIQKEVAHDYTADPPKATFLSNYAKIFSEVRFIARVPKEHFNPMPKVDGAIVQFSMNNVQSSIRNVSEFIKFLKAGFLQPRKKLVNNLIKVFETDKENLVNILQKAGVSKDARAAELSFADWEKLYKLK